MVSDSDDDRTRSRWSKADASDLHLENTTCEMLQSWPRGVGGLRSTRICYRRVGDPELEWQVSFGAISSRGWAARASGS